MRHKIRQLFFTLFISQLKYRYNGEIMVEFCQRTTLQSYLGGTTFRGAQAVNELLLNSQANVQENRGKINES
jgi:hypothetical protein